MRLYKKNTDKLLTFTCFYNFASFLCTSPRFIRHLANYRVIIGCIYSVFVTRL